MFPISYRDLERMLQDGGVEISHPTIFRWIHSWKGGCGRTCARATACAVLTRPTSD
jgi:transposase-like protein